MFLRVNRNARGILDGLGKARARFTAKQHLIDPGKDVSASEARGKCEQPPARRRTRSSLQAALQRAAVAALLAAASPPGCPAGTWGDYSDSAFAAAQSKGKPVLLQFASANCGRCDEQVKLLIPMLLRPEFKEIKGFRVDGDVSPEVGRRWKVDGFSTVIVVKDGKETGREAGIVTEEELLAFLRKAVAAKARGQPRARPSNRLQARP